jgi:hypothetical protein
LYHGNELTDVKKVNQHESSEACGQLGCQTVGFKTQNPNLGKFWRALEWKMLVYVMVIWNILRSVGIFYGHLGIFSLVLVYCLKKNLANLVVSQKKSFSCIGNGTH